VKGRALEAGRYRLRALARNGIGQMSVARYAQFTIIR